MRFYSTTHEEYVRSVQTYNLHPELENILRSRRPEATPADIPNMIVYGPSGVGKYSQVLHFLSKHSPRKLSAIKRLTAQFNRQTYQYQISDIHYEIDMGLLGCNSKLLWHEIFTQILDIVSVKADKVGVIVCKNFHLIHTELLEIFYSYIEHYNNQIRFIFITENVSFIPNKIYNRCLMVRVARPAPEKYEKLLELENIDVRGLATGQINNIKEYISFAAAVENEMDSAAAGGEVVLSAIEAKKSFIVICDEIIRQMKDYKKLSFTSFRDAIYDIFIYNLDVADCVWYILTNFISEFPVAHAPPRDIILRTYLFFKYFNNNYRPIYHLESLFIHIIRMYMGGAEAEAPPQKMFSKIELNNSICEIGGIELEPATIESIMINATTRGRKPKKGVNRSN
jgi:Cdc6-like AAA superfamily ATPase